MNGDKLRWIGDGDNNGNKRVSDRISLRKVEKEGNGYLEENNGWKSIKIEWGKIVEI